MTQGIGWPSRGWGGCWASPASTYMTVNVSLGAVEAPGLTSN